MILTVDTTSGSPPYEQIRSQVTKMIASGVLAPGDRLPTIAQLSADLGLATPLGVDDVFVFPMVNFVWTFR